MGHGADLTALLATQAGVVTRQQALSAGLTRSAIARRVRSGQWQRLLGGVYATFTGSPPRRSWLWAVLLRMGTGAVLSHQTAAELVGLMDRPAPAVHVTIPSHRRSTYVPGVAVHHSPRVAEARHPTRLPPQTRVEETVLDLAHTAGTLDDAIGWVTRACVRRLTTADRLRRWMYGRARLRWRRELAAALGDVASGCQSVLELRFLRDVERSHGLPAAVRQAVRERSGGRWYDDVHYPRYRVRVELDGVVAHPVEARGRDRRRDNAAVVAGDTVLRYGWAEVAGRPCDGAAELARVLVRHGWEGRPRACRRPDCTVVE